MSEHVYRGWATLIDHGFEIAVHADLVDRGTARSVSWGGHLQADRDEDFELMARVADGRLRLPGGEEATFTAVVNEVGTGALEIASEAAAPF
ncbi:hypothetical protein [Streptomyces tateyamensis]|uniref:hypothetical protein n=1 Tax=Streptomyces tateyamensis TaxID=565073 RepID=UPI0011B6DB1B|nr:hypothetical protein [Streptomyces tateyamensis]